MACPISTLLKLKPITKRCCAKCPKPKKRIVIAAMIVLWGERTAPIFIMLQDALKRGVKVTILLDNYTRLPVFYGLQPRATRSQRVKQKLHALEDLSGQGATIHCYGKLGFPPYKGRCHVKVTIIDDISYSFGGVNFFDQVFELSDYMLRSTDGEIADCLAQLVDRIGSSRPPLKDAEVRLDKTTSILFDGGRPKHSLIYERACELATQATRTTYVSAMVASGELGTLLKENDAAVYTNRPEQMLPIDGIGQAFDQQRYRLVNSYKGLAVIHAKFILFELPGGRKALLSGSNNFSYRGVSFGTQEVCLYSTDPALYKQLHHFLTTRIS